MYSDRGLAALHDLLLSSTFEQMTDPTLYRATALTVNSPMEQHNVFVSLGRDGIEVMAPIGPAADYTELDVQVVRNPDDGYALTTAGSYAALTRVLPEDEVIAAPASIVDRASDLAEYAGYVEYHLQRNHVRKGELLQAVQAATDDITVFDTTALTPEGLVAMVEELLALAPLQGPFNELRDVVVRQAMMSWASSSRSMSEDPWHKVVDGLERIAAQRGWSNDNG